jgi:SAM-dependent methyltransferase
MVGIDVSNYYAPRWAALGLEAYRTTADSFAREHAAAFDVITMRQVIEHTRDVVRLATACATMLKPGGHLLVETGDAGSWQARLQGRRWSFWVPAEGAGAHCSFLTARTARTLGQRVGLVLRAGVPHFRYRTFDAYRAERAGQAGPLVFLKYLLHLSALGGGRCFWYSKPV